MGISKHRSCPSEWSFVRSCAGFTTGTGVELNFNHVLWDFDTGFWPGCDTAFGMEIEWTRLDRRWVKKKNRTWKAPSGKASLFCVSVFEHILDCVKFGCRYGIWWENAVCLCLIWNRNRALLWCEYEIAVGVGSGKMFWCFQLWWYLPAER